MTHKLAVGIIGVCGRMGRLLVEAIRHHEACRLIGGVDHPDAGTPPSECPIIPDAGPLITQCDAVIDFSTPEACCALLPLTSASACTHVIGVTGFSAEQEQCVDRAARMTAIVKSGNMSLGVTLLAHLIRTAAAALSDEFDIEISERHHRDKVDAPSGTALLLGDAAATGRGLSCADIAIHTRYGRTGVRPSGGIGFSVSRGGGVIGDHDTAFISRGEALTLSHRALDRSIYAHGAVTAALWAYGKPPGRYDMTDILGIRHS